MIGRAYNWQGVASLAWQAVVRKLGLNPRPQGNQQYQEAIRRYGRLGALTCAELVEVAFAKAVGQRSPLYPPGGTPVGLMVPADIFAADDLSDVI